MQTQMESATYTWLLHNHKEIPSDISCVYKITHLNSELFYIGRSKDLRDRARKHYLEFLSGKHKNPKMLNIYNKYGDEFKIEVLVIASLDYCEELEGKLLLSYNLSELLNCHQNSKGGSTNQVWTEEQRKNHSLLLKGRKHSKESKANMSKANKESEKCKEHLIFLHSDEMRAKTLNAAASPESRKKAKDTRSKNPLPFFSEDTRKIQTDKARANLFMALNWAVANNQSRDAALKTFNSSWDSLKKYLHEWEAIYGELKLPKRASGEKSGVYKDGKSKESRRKKTDEELLLSRKLRSEAMKGENNPMHGRKHTDEAKEIQAQAARDQAKNKVKPLP